MKNPSNNMSGKHRKYPDMFKHNHLTSYRRTLLSSLLFLTYLGMMMITVSCDLTEQPTYEIQELNYAEEQSDSVTIYEIYGEHIERKITARKIERYYEAERIEATEVNIIDYNDDDSVRMTLYADFLTIDETGRLYVAEDNVVINHENAILYTDLLTWNQNNNEIFAPDEVIIIRGDNVLKGYELLTDADFTSIQLSRVTAEGHLDDEDFAGFDW